VQALAGEEDDDGVEQADEREGRDEADEVVLVFVFAEQSAQDQTGEDGRKKWDAQEDGDRCCGVLVQIVTDVAGLFIFVSVRAPTTYFCKHTDSHHVKRPERKRPRKGRIVQSGGCC